MVCRLCGSRNLFPFLDLGLQPPSDQFRTRDQLNDPVTFYPLEVNTCEICGFVQLGYVVPPDILYQDNYPYESSTTEMGRRHYHEFARAVVAAFTLGPGELAVDIGSNVGVLLEGFKEQGMRIQGVDPAQNICRIAESRGIPTINSFFNEEMAQIIFESLGPASVITGTNVFAHVNDLHSFMAAVKLLMHKERGIFIIESPHFLHVLKNLEYDTIYHEHLSYLSIEPLVPFLLKFGMEIINIEEQDIHGGSIRIFISHTGNHVVQDSVQLMLSREKTAGLRDKGVLSAFARRVADNKRELNLLLTNLKRSGKRIVAVSAPAKGMTLLNYCKIDKQMIEFATEKSTLKIGLYTPGALIPVFGDDKLVEEMPDYALLLAWNFAEEIIRNNNEFILRGGKFIIPIPVPTIV